MEAEIKTISHKYLIGVSAKMSLVINKTAELWQALMARQSEVRNRVDKRRYSVQIYDGLHDFSSFTSDTVFTKWAAFEVASFDFVPEGMRTHTLRGGEYAVFSHRGTPETFPKTIRHIFGEWLPNSDFELDDREHFEVLGQSYRLDDPDSEEEVWIPIRTATG